MKTKKTQLYENISNFTAKKSRSQNIIYLPNISRDFFNEAKPKHIKNFVLEMPITSIRTAVANANQDQLSQLVEAIHKDISLVKKVNKALSL